MNAARVFNIVLNIGGIIASIIGVICVAKIAFVRPWQINQLETEVVELAKVDELPPVSGKVPTDNFSASKNNSNELKSAIAELSQKAESVSRRSKPVDKIEEIESGETLSPRPFSITHLPKVTKTETPKPLKVEQPKEAKLTNTTPKTKSKPIAKKRSTPKPVKQVVTETRVVKVGLGGLSPKLGTAVAAGYLEHLGFYKPQQELVGDKCKVKGEGTFDKTYLSVSLEWDKKGKSGEANKPTHKFATQAVAVVVNKGNPINHLTAKQVADIMVGKTEQWQTVGGETTAIDIVAVGDQSGDLSELLKTKVLKPYNYSFKSENIDFLSAADATENIAASRGVIGLMPFESVDLDKVKLLAISASSNTRRILPTRVTVNSLDYPLASHLYLGLPEKQDKFSKGFVEFLNSSKTTEMVRNLGYTPLHDDLSEQGLEQYSQQIKALEDDKRILPAYRKIILEADRLNSQSNLSFNYGEMELTKESEKDLVRLATWLKAEKFTAPVVLLGFADSVGRYPDNKELSKKRAEVAAEFLKKQGIENTKSIGFGEEMPIGDNSLDDGRARNRRVEIWLVRERPTANG